MASPDDSESIPTAEPEKAPGVAVRAWALTLALALSAGLIAWACAEGLLVPEVAKGNRGQVRILPQVPAIRNALMSFGLLGAALGLSMGLSGGLIRRSVLWSVLAAAVGLVLGGLAGAGVAWFTLPAYFEHEKSRDIAYSLLVHGGTWTAIGAMAGLAFGLGRGGWASIYRCLLGAAAAALLATLIYEIVGMILFPLAATDTPLSKASETRLLARLLVAAMAAAGALISDSQGEGRRRRETEETAMVNPASP